MTRLLSNTIVPVASVDDATATAAAMEAHDADVGDVTLVYVVQKAGGAPDKAGVEQRKQVARDAFDAFESGLAASVVDERIVYDTDIIEGILAAAVDIDASAIVFTPRKGGRFVRLLTGDLSLRLIREADRPVVSLPQVSTE